MRLMSCAPPDKVDTEAVFAYFRRLQTAIANGLAAVEKTDWQSEDWHSGLGQGRGLSVHNGSCFERAGINYSSIQSDALPPAASQRYPQLAGQPYRAGGVSVVAHPHNPYCPTVHLNVRYFQSGAVFWFGGGMDLTPYYGFVEDCQHFHRTCAQTLAPFGAGFYAQFKQQCDDYFYIRHRQEARGVGGIFFDDFNEPDFATAFALAQAVGDSLITAYCPILARRQNTPYGERQQQWQQHRRGRYVEFNLIYDRGTLFGLQAGGRAESILMSLPPRVRWGAPPSPLAAEETRLLTDFLPPRAWL